jgi:hypothetical protein
MSRRDGDLESNGCEGRRCFGLESARHVKNLWSWTWYLPACEAFLLKTQDFTPGTPPATGGARTLRHDFELWTKLNSAKRQQTDFPPTLTEYIVVPESHPS